MERGVDTDCCENYALWRGSHSFVHNFIMYGFDGGLIQPYLLRTKNRRGKNENSFFHARLLLGQIQSGGNFVEKTNKNARKIRIIFPFFLFCGNVSLGKSLFLRLL